MKTKKIIKICSVCMFIIVTLSACDFILCSMPYIVSKPLFPMEWECTILSETEVRFVWKTPASHNANGYELERKADTHGSYQQIYKGSKTTFVDSNLNGNTKYYYRLRAFNKCGSSDWIKKTITTSPVTDN